MTSSTGDREPGPQPEDEPAIWLFGPEEALVRVAGAELLLAHLPVFLGGWPVRRAGGDAAASPDIAVREDADGTVEVETFGPRGAVSGFDNRLDAANGLAGALVSSFIAARPGHVGLHAGGALVGGGLAVLIGSPRSGKSSVALQLAAAGYRLFGDERIALRLGGSGAADALCLGLMPALPLPLPADCGPRLAEFVESYAEIRTETAVYMRPWDTEAAAFGETAPLAAVVVLERSGDAPAALEPAPVADVARALIDSAFAPQLPTGALTTAMTGLAGSVPGYRLSWTRSAAAARTLADRLTGRGGNESRDR